MNNYAKNVSTSNELITLSTAQPGLSVPGHVEDNIFSLPKCTTSWKADCIDNKQAINSNFTGAFEDQNHSWSFATRTVMTPQVQTQSLHPINTLTGVITKGSAVVKEQTVRPKVIYSASDTGVSTRFLSLMYPRGQMIITLVINQLSVIS